MDSRYKSHKSDNIIRQSTDIITSDTGDQKYVLSYIKTQLNIFKNLAIKKS